MAVVYASLYDPIVGASDGHGRQMKLTDETQVERTFELKKTYTELRDDLVDGINSVETEILRPALSARECIAPIRKTIKKRENKRLDVEKTQDKVHKLHRKMPRTPKEDAQLSKAEDDLAVMSEVRSHRQEAANSRTHSLTIFIRSSKSPTPICEKPYRPSLRPPSASFRPYSRNTSAFRISSWACTTLICTRTVRAKASSLRHRPWIRSLPPGLRSSLLRKKRLRPYP